MTRYVPQRDINGTITDLRPEQAQHAAPLRADRTPLATHFHDTNRESVAKGRPWPTWATWLLIVGAACALCVIAIVVVRDDTSAAVVARSTPIPVASPTAAGPRLGQALVAYYDPDDALSATALDDGTLYAFIGRQGDDWILVETEAGVRVWLRRADIQMDPLAVQWLAEVPDLTPPTPTPAPTAPPLPTQVIAPVRPAQAAPVPGLPVCVTVIAGPHTVEGCGRTKAEADAAAQAALRAQIVAAPSETAAAEQD